MIGSISRSNGSDFCRTAVALINGEGALANYPGPVLVLRDSGEVIAANHQAQALAATFSDDDAAGVGPLLERAISAGEAVVDTVSLPGTNGGSVIQFTVIPATDRSAALALGHDETLGQKMWGVLLESRQRFKELIEIASDFIWETGPDGAFAFVSPRGALGYSAQELIGRRAVEFVSSQADDAALFPFTARRSLDNVEVWFRRMDGRSACMDISCVPILDSSGSWAGARGVCRDVTEARQREAAIARARTQEQLFSYILQAINEHTLPQQMLAKTATAAARSLEANCCRIFRYHPEHRFTMAAEFGETSPQIDFEAALSRIESMPVHEWKVAEEHSILAIATHHAEQLNGAICLWRSKGEDAWSTDDHALLLLIAQQIGIVLEQIANKERLEYLSRTDPLTGLLNRRVFYEELDRRLAYTARTGRNGVLCYVDLDNFKCANDIHGHQHGDSALKAIARLLEENCRVNDLVARLGGDEFALWLDDTDKAGAERKAEALAELCAVLTAYSGAPDRPLGLSIGIAIHDPARGEDLKAIMDRADAAMYAVKRRGKGGFEVAAPWVDTNPTD